MDINPNDREPLPAVSGLMILVLPRIDRVESIICISLNTFKMVVPRRKQAWGRSDTVYETLDVIFERTSYEPAGTRRISELTCRFRDIGQEAIQILKAHTVSGKSHWDALT